MELRQQIALFLLGLLGITYAQDFYVAAPSTLRLNSDETIAIAYDGRPDETMTVNVQDYPSKQKSIFQKNILLKSGQPQTFKMKLNVGDFPPNFLSAPGSPKLVSMNVNIRNSKKEILIPINSESGYMFVQTDKPIYTPLERVSFRIIPLTEYGLPSTERFQLQIKNPDKIIVDEKYFNERNKVLLYYFARHHYTFPKYPILGEWTAVVRYGNNLEHNSSVVFELREYVLPTFTVKLRTPDVILPNKEEISIGVEAEYVYGQKVNGIVSFRFGVKRDHSANATYFGLKNPAGLVNGALKVYLSTKDLKNHRDIGWFPRIEGSIFVVEASVVDVATGNKIIEIDSKTRFSTSPFAISFKRCLSDFKPGLTSVFEADITFVGGKPAAGITTKLTAVADNGRQLNIAQSTSKSDDYGKVAFEFHPEIHHKALTLTLETTDERYAGSQAKGTFVQRAYQSKNNAYIAISRSSNARLRPEDVFSRDIHLEPKGIQNIYYLVMARGKIQRIAKFPAGAFKVHRMEFPITYDMVPNFRVIVFAHHGNDLVVDSLKIDVEKVCNPSAEVKLDPQFNQREPGGGGKIVIRGAKGTSVGLLGVDEAVYALSRKDLLTKEKMFDRLASHDLGCGPGGGLNVNSVLGNAGITIGTNKFVQPHTHSCVEVKRKKRSLAADIVGEYTGKEAMCCAMGLQPDPHDRYCEEKLESVEKSLEKIHENCTDIFLLCCKNAEEQNINGSVYVIGKLGADGQDAINFIDPEMEEEFERQTTVRKDFRETWINSDVMIRSNNEVEEAVSLPHSITTWVIQAVSLNPTHGICVAEPKKIVSFKKIFMHLNLPYSIKQYEQVEVQATVFNYLDKPITVFVSMYGVDGLCTGTDPRVKSERKRLKIAGQSAESVTFSVIPLRVEDIPIRITALSADGSDVIEKKLHVVPQGVEEEQNAVIRLDPTNRQKRPKRDINTKLYSDSIDPSQNLQVTAINLNPPDGTVPGTTRCTITAMGDLVGPAVETTLKDPDNLIQMPSGCGEQNMVRLAPTIYTMRYLKSTDKLTPTRRDKGYGFIRSGFDNELKYKKKDGSYSVWAHTPTSTWLTAFVMKVFCQGTEFVPIDKSVISSGVQWLITNQERDGSYIEKNRIYHREMMGGVDGTVSMTAYALIALEECTSGDQTLMLAKQRAIAFLEGQLNTVQTPLPAAIVAYALALTNSTVKRTANDRLLAMARYDPDNNYLYWPTKSAAQDIETTGYGLLTQLLLYDMNRATSIVNWLNTKQLQSGQFKSTQDTVIGLQALSEYSIKAPANVVNLVSNITSSRDKRFAKVLTFNKDNAMELQEIKVDVPEGMLFVRTAGTGMATLAMRLRYNVIKPEHEVCKFEIKETVTEVENIQHLIRGVNENLAKDPNNRRRRQANKDVAIDRDNIKEKFRDSALNINICLRYLGDRSTEMAIADVGLFSGFEPDVKDLEKLERDPKHLIEKYEKSKRGIVFYLNKVPFNKDYCFSFRVYREFHVGNTQSSVIKVYDYYNPDAVCTKFYTPDKSSALLKTLCEGGVCVCADGGCPPKEPFAGFTQQHTGTRRDVMINTFCDEYDYVWKGKIIGRLQIEEGYLNITFEIEEVIKAGTEKKEDVEKKIRNLRAHEHCETAFLLPKASYLILGKDPPASEKDNAKYYRYFLDKASIVHFWTKAVDSTNKNLQRDLDFVTSQLKLNGCLS